MKIENRVYYDPLGGSLGLKGLKETVKSLKPHSIYSISVENKTKSDF